MWESKSSSVYFHIHISSDPYIHISSLRSSNLHFSIYFIESQLPLQQILLQIHQPWLNLKSLDLSLNGKSLSLLLKIFFLFLKHKTIRSWQHLHPLLWIKILFHRVSVRDYSKLIHFRIHTVISSWRTFTSTSTTTYDTRIRNYPQHSIVTG